jgi:hypothetical protein
MASLVEAARPSAQGGWPRRASSEWGIPKTSDKPKVAMLHARARCRLRRKRWLTQDAATSTRLIRTHIIAENLTRAHRVEIPAGITRNENIRKIPIEEKLNGARARNEKRKGLLYSEYASHIPGESRFTWCHNVVFTASCATASKPLNPVFSLHCVCKAWPRTADSLGSIVF